MTSATPEPDSKSLGQLVATATADLSSLMRQEVELAKLEITRDVKQAVKGAGAFGAAGVAAVFGVLFLSTALAYAIGRGLNLGLGFLIVGLLYLVVAAAAGLFGKTSVKKVGPPEKTIETVKDDVAWAKHPTKTGA